MNTLLARLLASATVAAALLPGAASAAVNCTDSLRTDDTALNPSFVACGGSFSGNTPGTSVSFGGTTYDFVGKTGNDGSGTGPMGAFGADVNTGVLTFDEAWSGSFVVALKAGNAYSLYQFSSVTGVSSISFDTLGISVNAKDKGLGLSHVSVYGGTAFVEPQTTPVPEPTTMALALAGLGVIGLVARRRRPH